MKNELTLFYRSLTVLQWLAIACMLPVLSIVLCSLSGMIAPRSLMAVFAGLALIFFSSFSLVCTGLLAISYVVGNSRMNAQLLVSVGSGILGAIPSNSILIHYFFIN